MPSKAFTPEKRRKGRIMSTAAVLAGLAAAALVLFEPGAAAAIILAGAWYAAA